MLQGLLDETADGSRCEPEKPAARQREVSIGLEGEEEREKRSSPLVSRDGVLEIRDVDVDRLDDEERLPIGLRSVLQLDVEGDSLRSERKPKSVALRGGKKRGVERTRLVVERDGEKSLVLEVEETVLLVNPVRDVSGVESKSIDSDSETAIIVRGVSGVSLSEREVVVLDYSNRVGDEGGGFDPEVVDREVYVGRGELGSRERNLLDESDQSRDHDVDDISVETRALGCRKRTKTRNGQHPL